MKIQVKADGHNISIPIPTALIFSKPSVWLYLKLARKFSARAGEYIPRDVEVSVESFLTQLPEEAVYALCGEIMRIKKKYGAWKLVEIYSASGEEVHITL